MPMMRPRSAVRTTGFTLVEIAIALAVLTVLMTGMISILHIQTERTHLAETRAALDEARQALLGYAAAHGRLPCPASPSETDGDKFGTQGPCDKHRGLVPWKELGIRGTDGWDQYLSYQVSPSFTTDPSGMTTYFAFSSADTDALHLRTASSGGTSVVSDGAAAFALWSHGANGHFGITRAGVQRPGHEAGSVANPDEQANDPAATSSAMLVSHDEVVSTTNPGLEFDDLVIWESRFALFRSIAAAGYCIRPSTTTNTCDTGSSSSASSAAASSAGNGNNGNGNGAGNSSKGNSGNNAS